MKKILLTLIILLSFNVVFAAEKKQDLLDNIANIKTFTADFKQINTLKDFGDDEYTGKVYIKMKEKALWDYVEPYSSWYLVTKDNVDYYDEINNQLLKINSKEIKEHILLQVLMDFQKIKSTFSVSQKNNVVTLKPKSDTGVIYINIVFNNSVIKKLQSKDNTGNTTEIIFTNVEQDKKISDKVFNKKVPKDATIIKEK